MFFASLFLVVVGLIFVTQKKKNWVAETKKEAY